MNEIIEIKSPNIEVWMIGGGYGYELSPRSIANGFILKRSRLLTSQYIRRMMAAVLSTLQKCEQESLSRESA